MQEVLMQEVLMQEVLLRQGNRRALTRAPASVG
jgi:hypothetical protein